MRSCIIAITALLLSGCATRYTGEAGSFAGGYSELKLSADTYRVSDNGFTSRERAENIALLRAAELTLRDGYERFVVLGGNVSSQVGGYTPVVVNRVGNSLMASGGAPIAKPEGDLVIRMVARSDPAFATALDAKLIDAQLRPKLSSAF